MSARAPQPATSWLDYLKSVPLYALPHHLLSRLVFKITRIETVWFKNLFISWFADHFKIDWQDAVYKTPQDFKSFNAFFTRELREGARPLEGDQATIVSPADGHISQLGKIDDDLIFQAKGHGFTTTELLGGDKKRAQPFRNGEFNTVYLSPRDYHRLHMPITGVLRETIYIPGRLFSVAPHTARTVPNLFARNERLVAIFDTEAGPMAMVLVGAIFVAAIETVWSGLVTPPHRSEIEVTDYSNAGIKLERGAEMGRFNMGSTIIVLFAENRMQWLQKLQAGEPLRMGQAIGALTAPDQ